MMQPAEPRVHKFRNEPEAVMVKGQLIRRPLLPEMPKVTFETWEFVPTYVFAPCSVAELLQRCPKGVSYSDVKIETDKTGTMKFYVRRLINNLFYEEEMKVYHAKLAVYELEKKVWERQLEESRNDVRAESEKFAEIGGRHKIDPNEDMQSRDITRDWLQRVKEIAEAENEASQPKPPKQMSAQATVSDEQFAKMFSGGAYEQMLYNGAKRAVTEDMPIVPGKTVIIGLAEPDDGLPPTRPEKK